MGLDIIRFAAATMVMLFHHKVAWAGWVGVHVFFVISGFVIAYSAEDATPFRFARSRFVRLMPGVWIFGTAAAFAAVMRGDADDLGRRYLDTMILWPSGPWIDGVYWSLPVEIVFYGLVWVTLFKRLDLERLIYALGWLSTAYWLCRGVGHVFPEFPFASMVPRIPTRVAVMTQMFYGVHFAIGGLLYLMLRSGMTIRRFAACVLFLVPAFGQIVLTTENAPPGESVLLPAAFWLVAVGLIILSVWGKAIALNTFRKFVPAIRLLGLASYPLYLLHQQFGWFLMKVTGLHLWPGLLAIVGISVLAARFIEPPAQGFVRSLLDRLWQQRPMLRLSVRDAKQ